MEFSLLVLLDDPYENYFTIQKEETLSSISVSTPVPYSSNFSVKWEVVSSSQYLLDYCFPILHQEAYHYLPPLIQCPNCHSQNLCHQQSKQPECKDVRWVNMVPPNFTWLASSHTLLVYAEVLNLYHAKIKTKPHLAIQFCNLSAIWSNSGFINPYKLYQTQKRTY